MSLLKYKKQNKSKKSYEIEKSNHEEVLDKEDFEKVATALEFEPNQLARFRSDVTKNEFCTQQVSLSTNTRQCYMLEFGKRLACREYVKIEKFVILYLGLYPKDTGNITIRLRNDAYTQVSESIECEAIGKIGEMWGLVGSMPNSVHKSDAENLYLEIILSNSTLKNVITGELFMMWQYSHTDMPIQMEHEKKLVFRFKPMPHSNLNKLTANRVANMMEEIATKKRKEGIKAFTNILKDQHIEVYSDSSIVSEIELSGTKKIDHFPSVVETSPNTSYDPNYLPLC
uniref:Non-structural protein 4 n=1 Tax=Solenopsis invicta virus 14 TaxID=2810810 RepID=A0A891H5M9_9VIRU